MYFSASIFDRTVYFFEFLIVWKTTCEQTFILVCILQLPPDLFCVFECKLAKLIFSPYLLSCARNYKTMDCALIEIILVQRFD